MTARRVPMFNLPKLLKNKVILKMVFLKNIKWFKTWLTKDMHIARYSKASGVNHWFLKKFIILYNYFLVNREKITEETLSEIETLYTSFIDSIPHEGLKKEAEEYFFARTDNKKVDIRNLNSIIDFNEFNDNPNSDDAARKLYMSYLMPLGFQGGAKKEIGDLMYQNQKIKNSEIERLIPDLTERYSYQGNLAADVHAMVRNYRQLLSYMGICPEEEDGYEMSEVGKLLLQADQYLTFALYEHQKLKLRFDTPATVSFHKDDLKSYSTIEDFQDFEVNPYIAILEILTYLHKEDSETAYIDFAEYKIIICRETNFDIKRIIKKIKQYRNLSLPQAIDLMDKVDKRPAQRSYKNKNESVQGKNERYEKQFKNLIYGITELTKGDKDYINFLQYKDNRLSIRDQVQFEIYSEYIFRLKGYLQSKHNDLYKRISNWNSISALQIAKNIKNLPEKYSKKYDEFIESFLNHDTQGLNRYEYDLETLFLWKKYFYYVDYELLIYSYSQTLLFSNFSYYSENKSLPSEIFNQIPDFLINFLGIKRDILQKYIDEIVIKIYNKEDFLTVIEQNDLTNEIEDDEVWLEKNFKNNDYSDLVKLARINYSETDYQFVQGKRERIRNTKMVRLEKQRRLKDGLVMGEKRLNYDVDSCDICDSKFNPDLGEPECHHIIPFEIYGPDYLYNYAFLCKECHKKFTHKTLHYLTVDAINKLKLKGLIKKEYFLDMCDQNLITKDHIGYLFNNSYITSVEQTEFKSRISKNRNESSDEEDKAKAIVSRTYPSTERWARPMYSAVYYYRIKYKFIMDKVIEDYKVHACDSCEIDFANVDFECHHIIPKKEENLEGPETPFNFAFLCKQCHTKITPYKNKKDGSQDVIENLRKKGIVSKDTISKMILNGEILEKHLKFLHRVKFINKEELDSLFGLFEQKQKYSEI